MERSNTNVDYACEIRPFPVRRNLVIDAGYLDSRRHIIHGLLEVDVTRVRSRKGEFSFTAFIVASLARAVAQDPRVQAYRRGRRLVVFESVDVVTMIEPSSNAVAIPHILRNAQTRSVHELTQEIRDVQARPSSSHQEGRWLDVAARMPRWMRLATFGWFGRHPHTFKRMQGTVVVTSVGMFGQTGGFGLGFLPCHTLGLTVGGIVKKPAVAEDGSIQVRDFLNLTVSFDHDIVDGAPAARFTQKLVEILQSGSVLDEDLIIEKSEQVQLSE
jgi:2-oxoacid dehydrogenases acyltransferase (catalytic domain)